MPFQSTSRIKHAGNGKQRYKGRARGEVLYWTRETKEASWGRDAILQVEHGFPDFLLFAQLDEPGILEVLHSPTNFRLMIDLADIFWYLPLLIISVPSKAKSGQSSFVFCRKSFSQRQIDQARLQQTHGTQYPCSELDCGWLWHAYMKCSYKDYVYTSLWIYELYNIGNSIWLRDHIIHSVNTQTIYNNI